MVTMGKGGTDMNSLEVVDSDYHRNGVGGMGFKVALVDDPDEGDTKLVIMFEREYYTAVLSLDKLKDGDIAFGSNSYRGDRFDDVLRKQLFRD
jgi:hypothetical protein